MQNKFALLRKRINLTEWPGNADWQERFPINARSAYTDTLNLFLQAMKTPK